MKRKRSRRLRLEPLENRHLLTGWHNLVLPPDVNGDGEVTPIDALQVINALARTDGTSIELTTPAGPSDPFLDVDNNGFVTPIDALKVLNAIIQPIEPLDAGIDLPEAGGEYMGLVDLENFTASLAPLDLLPGGLMEAAEVAVLLDRASAASPSRDGIIAVVDRAGRILGVRVEAEVAASLQADPDKLAFAIDGAVAKARTAAFFSSNSAPLTSRTVRFISQSTVTQREVESAPVHADPRFRGPGFVAPIGVGGQFPPEIPFTPQVDLLGIERQSRDSRFHAGEDGVLGTADDFELNFRFNVDPAAIPPVAEDFFEVWPESYGIVTETSLTSRSRGIATLPGGVPLYKRVDGEVNLVGGIGVFFPGEEGFATYEQGFIHADLLGGKAQTEASRTNADRVLEAEFIALAASAGEGILGRPEFMRDVSDINAKLPPLPNFVALNGRIDLVGITLEIYGPTPSRQFRVPGIDRLLSFGRARIGNLPTPSGVDVPVNAGGDLHLDGMAVPQGWLVAPQDSPIAGGLSAAQVAEMVQAGVGQAKLTRAAIRLKPNLLPGASTQMVFAVADTHGNVLGVFRMPDATVFSIDVAIAKARNTAYYADPAALVVADRVDFNDDGLFGPISTSFQQPGDTLPVGTALTNRTFRFLAGPRFPTGAELPGNGLTLQGATAICDQSATLCDHVGPFSGLRLPGINPYTAENVRDPNVPGGELPLPFSVYADPAHSSPLFFDAFVPSRNFRDPGDAAVIVQGTLGSQPLANQNGVVFFPGSTPLYLRAPGDPPSGGTLLVGGLGVSGDGVDQDDVVTFAAQRGFEPAEALRADRFIVGGVRMPYQKFNRNPGLAG
ncbi:MAG: hypothetical protein EA381_11105 [Planctomycetaceae bacterium]|nr:MAG: hypothetical protein EA381_11105 [Planctomycetaceae bacterium]